ncbi:MAG: cupin domain-containing protein, partial [Bdellovibrionales bacterium]|nr:cupin domain-containing protein [Bdellovibrionales bacterium]
MSYFISDSELELKEIMPGCKARIVHSKNMTIAYWEIEKAAEVPNHHHPAEQIVTMVAGKFEMVIDGETKILSPGDKAVIPGNIPHSGKALEHCKIIDVWS